ncbi:fimbria/pilus outer membrane usher protein [Shigella flexneri]
MNAPGIKDAYVNGQKYRTTNRNGVVVYDGMTPYRENDPDAWMCRKAIAKQNYVATGKLLPLIARGCTG